MSRTRRSAMVVGVAVIVSRLFGLVREQVFAAMFGAGKLLDAYLAAFQIPNLLRDLFAEGALSTAFTTTFTKKWEQAGPGAAWQLARRVMAAATVVLVILCGIGILFSPWIVAATSYGFHQVPGKFELTVQLTQLLFPFILFVSLAALVMGILNARDYYALPASASTAFNIISVITGVALAFLFEAPADWRRIHFSERALVGVCIGVLLGGIAQLMIQLPRLWKLGFRWKWELVWNDPDLRAIGRLMLPSIIAGAAVQVNVLVNGLFASSIDGARSWLACAFRLMQFPIGVFGVAIATVTLPAVSRHRARSDLHAFGKTVEESLRFAFYLTIPATIGLMLLAKPLIAVIYQHGQFDAMDTQQTAWALQAYLLGLVAYSAIKVLVPCFYALDAPSVPLRVSLIGIGVNLILNIALMHVLHLGHVGLALSTGVVAAVNCIQLAIALRRHVAYGTWAAWRSFVSRIAAATLVMGLLLYSAASVWLWPWATTLPRMLLALTLYIGIFASGYFLITARLKLEEATALLRWLRARVGA